MKINKNDSIIICVEKSETNKKKKILYNLLTSYKYIDCILLNLFNFQTFQMRGVKTNLKRYGLFNSVIEYSETNFTSKIKKVKITKKLIIKIAGHS